MESVVPKLHRKSEPRQRSVSAEDQSWLDENSSLRWDPAVSTADPSRADFALRRYEFAMPYCRGKRVLDNACGCGYGSSMLSQVAREVCGIDQCEKTVDFAARNYTGQSLSFRNSLGEWTPFSDDAFDAIVCFEALEHMLSPRVAMREFVRLLTADGLAIVSVPNAWGYTEHHLTDTDLPFLTSLCNEFFSECEFFYNNSGDRPSQTGMGIGPLEGTNVSEAECLIAVCRQPRPLSRSQDPVSEMLADIYTETYERHDEFHKLQPLAASALLSEQANIDAFPAVEVGTTLALEIDGDHDYNRVLIRIEAEIVESLPGYSRIAIPAMSLSEPRLAQLQILSSDNDAIAAPFVRLVPSTSPPQ